MGYGSVLEGLIVLDAGKRGKSQKLLQGYGDHAGKTQSLGHGFARIYMDEERGKPHGWVQL